MRVLSPADRGREQRSKEYWLESGNLLAWLALRGPAPGSSAPPAAQAVSLRPGNHFSSQNRGKNAGNDLPPNIIRPPAATAGFMTTSPETL